MSVYYSDDTVTLHHGDCLDVLAELPDASVDSVVCDPPYALGFMGREWDSFGDTGRGARARTERAAEVTPSGEGHGTSAGPYLASGVDSLRSAGEPFQRWCEAWSRECLRILKPGGHLLAFGGTRTWHRLAVAVEDAGFEIRDSIAWMYGSGFPKSLDVSKAIDKAAGAEREVVGIHRRHGGGSAHSDSMSGDLGTSSELPLTAPAADAARTWKGWGTALKPAFEPIVVARKPLSGTVAANVLAHGTGALNIDGGRVGRAEGDRTEYGRDKHLPRANTTSSLGKFNGVTPYVPNGAGRWPSNVILDESQAAALDEQSGTRPSGGSPGGIAENTGMRGNTFTRERTALDADSGGASRYFYTAKADASERVTVDGIAHPTVKPLDLMRWLVRLVTPPGGTVLEPFAGSGTTVEACVLEGFDCIAIEREADYLPLITQRIHRRRDPVAYHAADGEDMGLFGLIDEEPA